MVKRLNKKIAFRISLIISSIFAIFTGVSRDVSPNRHVVEVLDIPLFSIEKTYASDGSGGGPGGCCGSSDGGIDFPPSDGGGPTVSGLGINFSAPSDVDYTCGGCGGCGCFTEGTQIMLGDGSEKDIKDITTEDTVKTSDGNQLVMRRYTIPYTGNLFAFNGTENYFVSPSHPFMTKDGWKSIDPSETAKETPNLVVSKLLIGDEIQLFDQTYLTINSIESKSFETTLYNFDVNGSHDYYADGYRVHNVATEAIEASDADKLAVVGRPTK